MNTREISVFWLFLVLVVVIILAGFVPVSFHLAKDPAFRAVCLNNTHQIGLAMGMYAEDHAGQYPASFGVLMKEGYLANWKVFICPSSKDCPAEGFPIDPQSDLKEQDLAVLNTVEEWGSYVLVKGLKHENRPDVIVLYEKAGHHKGEGRYSFFDDGHAKWLSETEFLRRMKAQEAKLREAPKKEVE